ncbi:MAG: GNAT family N-acetyltransferase [Acidobacteria bacterium]|nr:GNAT family N-acetyltransferase [Acidobacteriota bacterium]
MTKLDKLNLGMATLVATSTHIYPTCQTALPPIVIREGRYLAYFVQTREELDAALKLRFEVFNLELSEGLAQSFETGRDLDEFDETCHHLIVLETEQNKVVGTYRMQTSEMAAAGRGFYTASEFDLSYFPPNVLTGGIELGRACVAQSHRNTQVLFLLWKGLAAYVAHNRKRYLFGCCSLTSQDAQEGQRVMELLKEQGHLHPNLFAPPHSEFACEAGSLNFEASEEAKIPRLFRTYLRYGAKVCSSPAIDRQFKTIDFLVLFDVAEMDGRTARLFLGRDDFSGSPA